MSRRMVEPCTVCVRAPGRVFDFRGSERNREFPMSRVANHRRRAARQGALLSTELLLLLPILIVFFLAVVEIAFLISLEARLAAASREGARVAARGGDTGDVESAIALIFGNPMTSKVTFVVSFPNVTQNTGDPVAVKVTAPAILYVPNYLAITGYDLTGQMLSSETVMTIE